MRRQDDRYGNTRLYVGRLSSRTRSRDLEHLFNKYGRVRDVDMKHDFAFIDFSDPRDADDARYSLNGRDFDGSRLLVEFARGNPRGPGGSREYLGRGPTPGSGRCFNCGIDGHWARDCKAGDWKNKCYRCGERGHIGRSCPNSPKSLRRGRSYSRSPSPRRGRSRSRSYSRGHSYSRSRSPLRRGGRRTVHERSISPDYSRSPKSRKSPPPERKRSLSPDGSRSPREQASPSPKGRKEADRNGSRSPREQASPSPKGRKEADRNGSDYSRSPRRGNRRSPISPERESSPVGSRHMSPEANGRSARPRDAEDEDNHAYPRGSESPQD